MTMDIADALGLGRAALVEVGETVTFRGASVRVLPVLLAPDKRDKQRWQFGDSVASVIFLPRETDPAPTASLGEVITDRFGRKHRVIATHDDGLSWICGCVVSKA